MFDLSGCCAGGNNFDKVISDERVEGLDEGR